MYRCLDSTLAFGIQEAFLKREASELSCDYWGKTESSEQGEIMITDIIANTWKCSETKKV